MNKKEEKQVSELSKNAKVFIPKGGVSAISNLAQDQEDYNEMWSEIANMTTGSAVSDVSEVQKLVHATTKHR